MNDKNLTDSEIVKALECCCGDNGCFGCPYTENHNCRLLRNPIKDALDLINRLEARIGVYETCNARKDEAIRKLEAENERLKTNEERYNRIYHLLLDPLIVANGKNGELRPIKRTSRQDVYHTLLRAQEIMEIPYRWFPWKKDGDNK